MVVERKKVRELSPKKLKAYLEEQQPKYQTLALTRGYLRQLIKENPDDKSARSKVRVVEKIMDAKLAGEGGDDVVRKRRKPGTGTPKVTEHVYKDTPTNQKLGRVGQTYTRTTYEDAEYDTHRQVKMRRTRLRSKPDPATRRANPWIDAMRQAKQELGAPGFCIVRRNVSDPDDEEQQMGRRVYLRSVEIMKANKAAAAAAAGKEKPEEEPEAQAGEGESAAVKAGA
jgi:hypothetical protein